MSTTTPEQLRGMAAVAQVSLATVGDGDWNPQDSALERAVLVLRDAADEMSRLRAVIRNAPHDLQCQWLEDDPCDCWKATAL